MGTFVKMSEQDEIKLEELNLKVKNALEERRLWLDSKMTEYAKLKVGEKIYIVSTGQCLGVISNIYRLKRDEHKGVYDNCIDINYKYKTGDYSYDNTSRQYIGWGSMSDVIAYKKSELKRISAEIENYEKTKS